MKIISIIVPIFNEIDTLPFFFERLIKVINNNKNYIFEIVIINDGSYDESLSYIIKLNEQYKNIVIVDLSRNFGKEAALTAGIDTAIGDAVIPIDSDLQDPPELISKLIEKWENNNFDIIEAKRIDRKSDSFFKKISSALFYSLLNLISKNKISNNVGDFRLVSREVVNSIKKLNERNRYMKGILSWPGFQKSFIEYKRDKRVAGKTKFSFFKLLHLAIDGITSFSIAPLKIITFLGFVGLIISLIFAIIILFQKFFLNNLVTGYAFLILIILFFSSVQLLSLGVMGEYIGKIYFEVKRRPIYIIKKIYK